MQNIPVYVVGNKADLCTNVLNSMRGGHHGLHHHSHSYHKPSTSGHHHTVHHGHTDHDLTPAFKDLANLVKKQWKCNYLECSAKYNWRLMPIFRDIIRLIDANQLKLMDKPDHRDDHHRDSIKFSLSSSIRTRTTITDTPILLTTTTTTTATTTTSSSSNINRSNYGRNIGGSTTGASATVSTAAASVDQLENLSSFNDNKTTSCVII